MALPSGTAICRSTRRPSGKNLAGDEAEVRIDHVPEQDSVPVLMTMTRMCGKRERVQRSTSNAQRPTFQLERNRGSADGYRVLLVKR